MRIDGGLYRLVYEYYEARILHGYYKCGEALPSIHHICKLFHMAPSTVRSALVLLEKSGYIQMDGRKNACVAYFATPEQYIENAARYFAPRMDGILDLSSSGPLLLEPLWKAGLMQWSDEDWEILRLGITEPGENDVAMPVEFFLLVLSALNNKLILNFYWEVIRYVRFPYLNNREEMPRMARTVAGWSREAGIAHLKKQFDMSYEKTVACLLTFVTSVRERGDAAGLEPISFTWNIYRRRPQLRYSLVSVLIREIVSGVYPPGSYLPSLPNMVQKYGVALNTVRRTLLILEGLGLSRSYHGKGTQVCTESEAIDFSQKDIQQGFDMYVESLRLFSLTAVPVLTYTLEHVESGGRALLLGNITDMCRNKKGCDCYDVLLGFVAEHCPLALVRECYGRLKDLLVWGYPFMLSRVAGEDLHERYRPVLERSETCLKQGDVHGFANLWKMMLEKEEAWAGAYMKDMDALRLAGNRKTPRR